MIKLYVMEGNYVNTEDELEKDGSENSVKGAYEVNICDWEYQNEQGNTVDRIIKDHCISGTAMPAGYICLEWFTI